jgi:type VI secretion system protein ImpK
MSSDWDHAADWGQEPLQVQYFGQFLAGEEFFHRLDALLGGSNLEVLDVYFTCLCAGFRGMYRDDPDALATRRRRVYQLMKKADQRDDQRLTEAAYGRNLERSLVRSHFPVWWLAPFVGTAVFLYLAFWVVLGQQVRDIVRLAG